MRKQRTKFETICAAIACALMCGLWAPELSVADEKAKAKITFDDHVGPLFKLRCSSCHNPNKKSGDLDVTSLTNLLEGGASGEGVQPGDVESTYLFSLILHEDSPEMPPGGKLPDKEIELVKNWIEGGALENSGSKAVIKPKFDMAMSESPNTRPAVLPMPARMPLEPAKRTKRASAITAIATSPWAPVTALAAPGQVVVYNTSTLGLIGVLPMENGVANSLRFSRNGSILMAGGGVNGAEGYVQLWNIKTGEPITRIGSELDSVLAADISPDHSMVAIGGPNKLVKVFSTADGSLLYEIKKHTDWVTSLEFSPDGKYLVSGDRNGGLHLWYAEDGTEHLTLKAHSKMISSVSWRTDGKVLVSASEDSTIRIWEAENGKQIKSWGSHGGVTSVEFANDGRIVTCGRDKWVRLWGQDGKQQKQYGGLTDVAVKASYCDESKRVVSGDWTGLVKVWNADDQKELGVVSPNPPRLVEHVQWHQAKIQEQKKVYDPLANKVAEINKAVAQTNGSLQQATQQQTTKQAAFNDLNGKLQLAKKQLDSTVAEQNQWRKELNEKSTARGLIAESHKKAAEAFAQLPNDADLKATVEKLLAKVKSLDARNGELKNLVAQSDQKKNTTQKQVTDLTQMLASSQTELNAINQQVSQLQKEVGVWKDQLGPANDAANQAKTKLDQLTAGLNYWNAEVKFVGDLAALRAELSVARDEAAKQQTQVAEAEAKVKAAEEQATYVRSVHQEAEKKVDSLQERMKQLRGTK